MQTFVATINDPGASKLRNTGVYVRAQATTLRFHEDDARSAHIFYRRYIRNFTGVLFGDADYSLYAEPSVTRADSRALGMRENPDCRELARPGRCGAHSLEPAP